MTTPNNETAWTDYTAANPWPWYRKDFDAGYRAALEEAAKVAENTWSGDVRTIAAAIRALGVSAQKQEEK